MLIAGSLPVALQVILGVIGGVAALAAVAAAVWGGYYIFKGRKATAAITLADSAVASLTAANVGLESRLGLVEQDNRHCLEMNKQRDLTIEQMKKQHDATVDQMNKRITDLREDVTQRALVAEFRDEARGFLVAIANKLDIEVTEHPPLPPTP